MSDEAPQEYVQVPKDEWLEVIEVLERTRELLSRLSH
jgi:hypothetical protein